MQYTTFKPMSAIRLLPAVALAFVIATPAEAQLDGTRVNWPLPKNLHILGAHALSGTVNATLTNLHRIQPSIDIDNQLYLLTYSRSQPILGRSVLWTAVVPAGVIRTSSNLPLPAQNQFAHGVGDPSLGTTINLIGAPALMLREYARYDLGTVVSFGINASFPLGQYDPAEALNIGSNQYRVRFALPVVRSLGAWVPGRRTTIEVTPSVTWISNNGNNQGNTVEPDPMAAVEAHLTRDVTRNAAISLDYSYLRIGASTATSNTTGSQVSQVDARDAHLLGVTLNYAVNDNLALFITHMQTIDRETTPVSLEGALFRITLTYSFHRVIERRRVFMD